MPFSDSGFDNASLCSVNATISRPGWGRWPLGHVTVQWTLYTVHCTLYTVQPALHSTLYTVQPALHSAQCRAE